MTLQHVTYEQTKKLKKLGFNWHTPASYVGNEYVSYMGWQNTWKLDDPKHQMPKDETTGKLKDYVKPMISAPTVALASKWLREERKCYVIVGYDGEDSSTLTVTCNSRLVRRPTIPAHLTYAWDLKEYEQAESGGLDFALNYLENI
jgi:hypothetical protein